MLNASWANRRDATAVGVALLLSTLAAQGISAAAETKWSLELRGRYRSSDDARFRVNFPFGESQIPAGQDGVFLRTVSPGNAVELSVATLQLEHGWAKVAFGLKFDYVDLDDRNPTSSAEAFDLDELWLRFGREPEPAIVPSAPGWYLKAGKFPHFERQDDRHLQSYGLVTTAFNRLEDVGAEVGVDLGRFFYLKASYTQGNPLFMRDPNALAGDNGTPAFTRVNPRPEYNSGIVLPYDADVHDIDFNFPETAFGLGGRMADPAGDRGVDLLVWVTARDLAPTVAIDGSFYGGDLDLLRGPHNLFSFPLTSTRKRETGVSLWLYLRDLSLFAQFVEQDLAGLPRSGIEAELAWRFDLPLFWSIGDRQILSSLAPAVRYSRLDPDFSGPAQTPTPSFTWGWEKWDWGLRIGLADRSDLTIEYTDNEFTLASGTRVALDELLATLRFRFGN